MTLSEYVGYVLVYSYIVWTQVEVCIWWVYKYIEALSGYKVMAEYVGYVLVYSDIVWTQGEACMTVWI